MALVGEILALSKTYPIVAIVLAIFLFIIGLRITGKLLKWIFWVLAGVAVVAAFVMIFL